MRTREDILEDIEDFTKWAKINTEFAEYCTNRAEDNAKWAEEYTKCEEDYKKWAEISTKNKNQAKQELKELDEKEKGDEN